MIFENLTDTIGLFAAVALPLFNIPLVLKIIKRQSSQDISLSWAIGVWVCILLMAPSGFTSVDIVWKTFSIMNVLLFTVVVIVTLKHRKGSS